MKFPCPQELFQGRTNAVRKYAWVRFEYKDGRVENGMVLEETPFTFHVRFGPKLFGTIHKELVETVRYSGTDMDEAARKAKEQSEIKSI